MRTGRRTGGFKGIGGDLRALALSPSGRLLAVISDRELKIWDVTTGRPTGVTLTVQGRFDGGDTGASFGQAENRLAVIQGEALTIVNLTTGKKRSPPTSGSFDISPDGRGLAVGGIDGTVTAWTLDRLASIPLGEQVRRLRAGRGLQPGRQDRRGRPEQGHRAAKRVHRSEAGPALRGRR